MENGCHGHQDASLQWPNIQISSKYIHLCVYQIWCLYDKMNNRLAMPPHYPIYMRVRAVYFFQFILLDISY